MAFLSAKASQDGATGLRFALCMVAVADFGGNFSASSPDAVGVVRQQGGGHIPVTRTAQAKKPDFAE
jgi:hypothetical protein